MIPKKQGFKLRCHDKDSFVKFAFPAHKPVWKDDIKDNESEDFLVITNRT